MAYNRSATTQAIACVLSDEPMTIHDLMRELGVSIGAVQNSVCTLLHAGECREIQVMGTRGRMVRGFVLPLARVKEMPRPERGEYTGEPRPLRYQPRPEPYISLGKIGTDVLLSTQQEIVK